MKRISEHQFGSTIFISEYLISLIDLGASEMKKWEKIGKFGELTMEACGDKRRLIDAEGNVVEEYTDD